MELKKASLCDAEKLLQMQKDAFAEIFEKYRDYDTNPACETPERMMQKLSDGSDFYFITNGSEILGAIRIITSGTRKRISPLFILKQHRGKGFAQAAIRLAENIYGEHGWELSTIMQEKGNCRLYEKLGYRRTGETQRINERMDIVFYEKD